MNLNPFMSLLHSLSLCVSCIHIDAANRQHSQNTLWNTGCESSDVPIAKVCFCLHAIPKSKKKKKNSEEAFAIMLLQWRRCLEKSKRAQRVHRVVGRDLFAVFLHSNNSFMQSFTEALCVVHFGPICRADGHGGRVVVFLTSFFNIGQCCL